jgi:hypothetical protein
VGLTARSSHGARDGCRWVDAVVKLFDLAEYSTLCTYPYRWYGVAAEACSSSWFDLSSPHVFDLSRLISREFAGRRQLFFILCVYIGHVIVGHVSSHLLATSTLSPCLRHVHVHVIHIFI